MSVYLRPLGLFASAIPADTVLPLSNTGLCFSAVEIITRNDANVESQIVPVADIKNNRDEKIQTLLARLTAPRAEWAGLSLNQTRIMGVLNATPDSFSDGGDYFDIDAAIIHANEMTAQSADIIDVGGESTRPKAAPPSTAEELRRTIPVIETVGKNAIVSVDTRRAEVMQKAIKAGAVIINDVSALTHDPDALQFVADNQLPVILMHMQGTPQTMQDNPHYVHAALEVYDWLEQRILACEAAGLPRHKIIIDPGIGFGKTLNHNLVILNYLSIFHGLGCGILIGVSRKSFIGKLTGEADAKKRLPGSLAAALYAVSQGVKIVRAHDVKETRDALTIYGASAGLTAV